MAMTEDPAKHRIPMSEALGAGHVTHGKFPAFDGAIVSLAQLWARDKSKHRLESRAWLNAAISV